MGFSGFDWADAAEVYDEFAALTAGRPCDQSGVSHARLDREGTIQWPCRSADGPGHRAAVHRRPLLDGVRRARR